MLESILLFTGVVGMLFGLIRKWEHHLPIYGGFWGELLECDFCTIWWLSVLVGVAGVFTGYAEWYYPIITTGLIRLIK